MSYYDSSQHEDEDFNEDGGPTSTGVKNIPTDSKQMFLELGRKMRSSQVKSKQIYVERRVIVWQIELMRNHYKGLSVNGAHRDAVEIAKQGQEQWLRLFNKVVYEVDGGDLG